MRLLIIIGVRPNVIKLSALLPVINPVHDVRIVHTGQHYDDGLSGQFLREYNILAAEKLDGIRQHSRIQRVARTMLSLETLLESAYRPELVVVIGDSDPAYGGAIAAAIRGLPVAHIEAGLRSQDGEQVEEKNRKVIDSICALHFAPTRRCLENLQRENIVSGVMSGDLHLDALWPGFRPLSDFLQSVLSTGSIRIRPLVDRPPQRSHAVPLPP